VTGAERERLAAIEDQLARLAEAVNAMSMAIIIGEALQDLPAAGADPARGRPRRPPRPRHLHLVRGCAR
jgi:hypothetical protein